METWGQHRKMPQQTASETTNQKIYSKLHCDRHELLGSSEGVQKSCGEKSIESCLDQARTANFGYRKIQKIYETLWPKIIRIHHRFQLNHQTQWCSFELYCDSNSPLPTLWSLHELNVFAKKTSGNGFLKPTNMSHQSSHQSPFCRKAGSPASNPLWLKAQSWQWFFGLLQSHVTIESIIDTL